MNLGVGPGVRRVKQAAVLLTMATAMGWSAPSADARASRAVEVQAVETASVAMPTLATFGSSDTGVADGEWRYIPSRR